MAASCVEKPGGLLADRGHARDEGAQGARPPGASCNGIAVEQGSRQGGKCTHAGNVELAV